MVESVSIGVYRVLLRSYSCLRSRILQHELTSAVLDRICLNPFPTRFNRHLVDEG